MATAQMLDLSGNDRQQLTNDRLSRRSLNDNQGSESRLSSLQPLGSCEDPDRSWSDLRGGISGEFVNNRVSDNCQKSTNASQCGSDGPNALSGVEWSLQGRYPPMPSTSSERIRETIKQRSQLRDLMKEGRVGAEEDATLRVKLQLLLMALQKDAKHAAQQDFVNRIEILENLIEDLHELLDMHEMLVKAKSDRASNFKSTTPALNTAASTSSYNRLTKAAKALLAEERFTSIEASAQKSRQSPGIRLWATSSTTPCNGDGGEEQNDDWPPQKKGLDCANDTVTSAHRRRRFQSNLNDTRRPGKDSQMRSATAYNETNPWGYDVATNKNLEADSDKTRWMRQRIAELERIVEKQRLQLQGRGESAKYRGRISSDQRRIHELSDQVFALQTDLEARKQQIARLRKLQQSDGHVEHYDSRRSRRGSANAIVVFEEIDYMEIKTQTICLDECVKLRIYITNLNSVHVLEELEISFAMSRALQVEMDEDWPKYILPRNEIVRSVTFACGTFFVSSPLIVVSVEIARRARTNRVPLPVTIIRFCRPAAVSLSESNQLANNPLYIRNEISGSISLDPTLTMDMLQEALVASDAFRVVAGSKSPHMNMDGGKFVVATQPMVESRLAAIATIQVRSMKCNVIVRSVNATLSEGIFHGIRSLLTTLSERIFPF